MFNKMEEDKLLDGTDNNVTVSSGFWFCCRDLFNCLVCIQCCRGGSVTVA